MLIIVLLIAAVCVTVVLRMLGMTDFYRKKAHVILEKEPPLPGDVFTAAMGWKTVAWCVGTLLALYGGSIVYCAVAQDGVSMEQLYRVWSHADAVHYRNLAELGYHGYIEDGQHLFLVFFPLYPWLVRFLHLLISDYSLSGHLLSALSYMGGCYVFARLVTEEFGWRTGRMSLMLFSAYPYAFFFAGMYTESLFFLLSVTAFYCIRRHRYFWAGLFGALAALTRMQGIFLMVAGFAEYAAADRPLKKLKAKDWKGLWRDAGDKLAPLVLMLAGVYIYLLLNYKVEGDPLRFLFYQREHWYQYSVPLPECLDTIWSGLTESGNPKLVWTIWLPDLAVFFLCLFGLLYAARRLPVTWVVYFLICLVLNYSLSWPLSCGRYIACAFPLPVAIAVMSRRRPFVGQMIAHIFALLQGAFLIFYLSAGVMF